MAIESYSNDDLLAQCLAGINMQCLDAEEAIQKYKDEINHDQSQINWYQSHIDAKTRVAEHTKGGGIAHTAHGATIYDTVYKYSATQRQEWEGQEDAAKKDLADATTALQSLQDRLNNNSIQLTTMIGGAYNKLQLLDDKDDSIDSARANLQAVQKYTEALVSFLVQQIVAQDAQKDATAKSMAAGESGVAANMVVPAADPSAARAETSAVPVPVLSEVLPRLPVFIPAALSVQTDADAPQTLTHPVDPAFLHPILDAVEKDVAAILSRPDVGPGRKMEAILPYMSGIARLSSALLETVAPVQSPSVQPVNTPVFSTGDNLTSTERVFNPGESLRPIVDRLIGLVVLTHTNLPMETIPAAVAPEASDGLLLNAQMMTAPQAAVTPAAPNEMGMLFALATAVPGLSKQADVLPAYSETAALPKPNEFAASTSKVESLNQTTGVSQMADEPVRLENPVQSPAPANVIVEERPASQAEPISTAGVLVSETNPFTAQTQNPIGDLAAAIQPVSPSIHSLRLLESAIQSLAASPYYIAPILESGVAEQAALEGVVKTFGQGGVPGSIGLSAAEIANAGVEHSAVRTILLPPVALAGSAPELFQEFQGEATGSEGSDEEGESAEGLSSGVSVQDLDVNDRILSV